MDNRFNKVFPSFDSFNSEFFPSSRIINDFSIQFSFYLFNKHSNDNLISCIYILDNLAIVSFEDPFYALIVTDASTKSNMATSIAHIYICDKTIVKTLHYMLNVTSTKAELFAIKCSINQATNIQDISRIVVVMDLIHTAKRILILLFIHSKFTLLLY